jgi:hypothetical protein
MKRAVSGESAAASAPTVSSANAANVVSPGIGYTTPSGEQKGQTTTDVDNTFTLPTVPASKPAAIDPTVYDPYKPAPTPTPGKADPGSSNDYPSQGNNDPSKNGGLPVAPATGHNGQNGQNGQNGNAAVGVDPAIGNADPGRNQLNDQYNNGRPPVTLSPLPVPVPAPAPTLAPGGGYRHYADSNGYQYYDDDDDDDDDDDGDDHHNGYDNNYRGSSGGYANPHPDSSGQDPPIRGNGNNGAGRPNYSRPIITLPSSSAATPSSTPHSSTVFSSTVTPGEPGRYRFFF